MNRQSPVPALGSASRDARDTSLLPVLRGALLLLGLSSLLLTLSLARPARNALLDLSGITSRLMPNRLQAAIETGLPKVELRETRGHSYRYIISFDGYSYAQIGTADSAAEVYWRAFEETIKAIERNS